MITDFFLDLFESLALWVIGLLPETADEVGQISSMANTSGSALNQVASFFGALNHWFPVTEFFIVAALAITVEVVIVTVKGLRTVKQLLPFQ